MHLVGELLIVCSDTVNQWQERGAELLHGRNVLDQDRLKLSFGKLLHWSCALRDNEQLFGNQTSADAQDESRIVAAHLLEHVFAVLRPLLADVMQEGF